MEILTPEQYGEFEAFVSAHPQGCFTQSVNWQKVKNNWGYEAVVSRTADGTIQGAVSVLVQKIPLGARPDPQRRFRMGLRPVYRRVSGEPSGSEKPCARVLRASRAGCARRQCSPPVRGKGVWLAGDAGASAQFGDHLRGCAGRYGHGRPAQPARRADVKRWGRQIAVRKVETVWRF